MAKPPEPLSDVLPKAAWVVDAVVAEVVKEGAEPPTLKVDAGATSTGQQTRAQTVKLTVRRVLKGTSVTELVVEKPLAQYALRAGNQGAFVIDASKTILGRYGPDSWPMAKVEAAVK